MRSLFVQAESPIEPDVEELQSMYASMSASCTYSGAPAKTVSPILISS